MFQGSRNSGRSRAKRHGGRRNRMRARLMHNLHHSETVPKEFFCPISKKFMDDPVTIPNSHLTYDRKSVEHVHKPEDVLPDLRTRKRMNTWFSQYINDPPFDSISTRGFLVGSVISIVNKRSLYLLREFARAIEGKPWLLKNGGGMWCVATLLSCDNPSVSWVTDALSIVADVDNDENFSLPEGIDIGIHPDYSILNPIKEALEYYGEEYIETVDFKTGFANFMHGLVMSSPDISYMEGKLEGIVEALVKNMWPVPQSFEFDWYLKNLGTLERLSDSHEFCERMFNSEVIWMLLLVMDSGISSIESIQEGDGRAAASQAIGTCMRIMERVCDHSSRACTQLRDKVLHEIGMLCKSLSGHLKLVGHCLEGSELLDQLLGIPGMHFRIDVDVCPECSL